MNVIIRKLYNSNGIETGVILHASVNMHTTAQQKGAIESQLENYVRQHIYTGIPLNIYSEVNTDTPSIVAIKDINALNQTSVTI